MIRKYYFVDLSDLLLSIIIYVIMCFSYDGIYINEISCDNYLYIIVNYFLLTSTFVILSNKTLSMIILNVKYQTDINFNKKIIYVLRNGLILILFVNVIIDNGVNYIFDLTGFLLFLIPIRIQKGNKEYFSALNYLFKVRYINL
jgi:hypothetical protein